jgi:hypothetical protein
MSTPVFLQIQSVGTFPNFVEHGDKIMEEVQN